MGQNNLSPYQLWIQGMTLLQRDEAVANGVIGDTFDTFCEAYNHHRITGQNNLSPYQLWIQGMTLLSSCKQCYW